MNSLSIKEFNDILKDLRKKHKGEFIHISFPTEAARDKFLKDVDEELKCRVRNEQRKNNST